ncbi:hypothetical protein WDZ92_51370, partial [Nostoc sp. NIES-2111]
YKATGFETCGSSYKLLIYEFKSGLLSLTDSQTAVVLIDLTTAKGQIILKKLTAEKSASHDLFGIVY